MAVAEGLLGIVAETEKTVDGKDTAVGLVKD